MWCFYCICFWFQVFSSLKGFWYELWTFGFVVAYILVFLSPEKAYRQHLDKALHKPFKIQIRGLHERV